MRWSAVCMRGYQRNKVNVDLLVRTSDATGIREVLAAAGWNWDQQRKQFVATFGIVLQFLLAGERAGSGVDVRLPDPADEDAVTEIEGLPVLKLANLIECKLACGKGNARRMHKDIADVVELIALRNLNKSFARKLH